LPQKFDIFVDHHNNINKMSNHLSSQAIEQKTPQHIVIFMFFDAFISAQNYTIAG
jgi:ribonuclease HIII